MRSCAGPLRVMGVGRHATRTSVPAMAHVLTARRLICVDCLSNIARIPYLRR
jgi:hypothetical protein